MCCVYICTMWCALGYQGYHYLKANNLESGRESRRGGEGTTASVVVYLTPPTHPEWAVCVFFFWGGKG